MGLIPLGSNVLDWPGPEVIWTWLGHYLCQFLYFKNSLLQAFIRVITKEKSDSQIIEQFWTLELHDVGTEAHKSQTDYITYSKISINFRILRRFSKLIYRALCEGAYDMSLARVLGMVECLFELILAGQTHRIRSESVLSSSKKQTETPTAFRGESIASFL